MRRKTGETGLFADEVLPDSRSFVVSAVLKLIVGPKNKVAELELCRRLSVRLV